MECMTVVGGCVRFFKLYGGWERGGGERNNFLGARFARRIRAFQKALFKVGSSDMNVDMTVSGHPDPVNSNDKAR